MDEFVNSARNPVTSRSLKMTKQSLIKQTSKFTIFVAMIVIASVALESCQSNYFIDPIATPMFTHAWQGNLQANLTIHDKFWFDAAASLPCDFVVSASREFWGKGLDNDQEMTSIAAGKFWAKKDVTLIALGGFGYGSQRTGPAYPYNNFQGFAQAPVSTLPPSASKDVSYLYGRSDFRKYFLEFEYASSTSELGFGTSYIGEVRSSWGLATRLEYLDRFQYSQSVSEIYDTSSAGIMDTTYTTDGSPKHSLTLDLGAFVTMGIPYVPFAEVIAQILLHVPINGNFEYQEFGTANIGLRFTF